MENIRYYESQSEFNSDYSILSDKTNPHVAYTVETDKAYITPLDDVTAEYCMVNLRYKSSSGKYNLFNVTGETIVPEVDYVYEKMFADGTRTTKTGSTLTSLNGATISFGGTNVNTSNGSVHVVSRGSNEGPKLFITTSTVTITVDGYSQSTSVNIYQAKNETKHIWETPSGLALTVGIIPASGGNISNGSISGSITQKLRHEYSSGEITWDTYTYGMSSIEDSYYSDPISGNNLGTTKIGQQNKGILTYYYKVNGIWGSSSANVYQEGNDVISTTYGIPQGITISSVGTIPASGGTISSAVTSGNAYRVDHRYWISKAEDDLTVNNINVSYSWNSVTANTLSTTLTTGLTFVGSIVCTYTDSVTNKSNTASSNVYQAINSRRAESTYGGEVTYSDVTSGNLTPSTYNDIPASGGVVTFECTNGSQIKYTSAIHTIYRYDSNGTKDEITTVQSQEALNITGSLSTTSISGGNLGTTKKDRTYIGSCTCTWSGYGNKSASKSHDVYQEKNEIVKTESSGGDIVYGSWTIGKINDATIHASGGSATATVENGTQYYEIPAGTITETWTSGSKSTGSTESSSGSVVLTPSITSLTASAESRGANTGDTITIKEESITWYREGNVKVGDSGTVHVYQGENRFIRSHQDKGVTAYTAPTITVSSNSIAASGGSATITLSGNNALSAITWGTFTAGVYQMGDVETIYSAASFNWVISTNSNSRFSKNGDTVNHSSMEYSIATDLCVVSGWNVDDSSKSATLTVANVSNDIISVDLQSDVNSVPGTGGTVSLYVLGKFNSNKETTIGQYVTFNKTAYTASATVEKQGDGGGATAAIVTIGANSSSYETRVVVSATYGSLSDTLEITVGSGKNYYAELAFYATSGSTIEQLSMGVQLVYEKDYYTKYVTQYQYSDYITLNPFAYNTSSTPYYVTGFGTSMTNINNSTDSVKIADVWDKCYIEVTIPMSNGMCFNSLGMTMYGSVYTVNASQVQVDTDKIDGVAQYTTTQMKDSLGVKTYDEFIDKLLADPKDNRCGMPMAFVVDYGPKTI